MRVFIFLIGLLALAVCVYGILLFRKRLQSLRDNGARMREEILLAEFRAAHTPPQDSDSRSPYSNDKQVK